MKESIQFCYKSLKNYQTIVLVQFNTLKIILNKEIWTKFRIDERKHSIFSFATFSSATNYLKTIKLLFLYNSIH